MPIRKVAGRESERDPASQKMLAEYEAAVVSESPLRLGELAEDEERQLRLGTVRAVLWLQGPSEAAGLALWDFLPGVGRRVRLYLADGHRSASDLGLLLDELDERSEHDGPIASVVDFIPGVSDPIQEEALSPRSFFRVERVALRRPPDSPFPDEDLFDRPDLRPLESSDEEEIARLMREAYDQTAGEPRPWFLYRDPRQDARDAVREIFEGRRGEWLPWASFGVEASGNLVGASLVTRLDVPILSEIMVAPKLRGIGLGYHLGLESIRVLLERDLADLHAVTTSNDFRALRLARRLGFEPASSRAVGLWVNRVAIGVLPPPPGDFGPAPGSI